MAAERARACGQCGERAAYTRGAEAVCARERCVLAAEGWSALPVAGVSVRAALPGAATAVAVPAGSLHWVPFKPVPASPEYWVVTSLRQLPKPEGAAAEEPPPLLVQVEALLLVRSDWPGGDARTVAEDRFEGGEQPWLGWERLARLFAAYDGVRENSPHPASIIAVMRRDGKVMRPYDWFTEFVSGADYGKQRTDVRTALNAARLVTDEQERLEALARVVLDHAPPTLTDVPKGFIVGGGGGVAGTVYAQCAPLTKGIPGTPPSPLSRMEMDYGPMLADVKYVLDEPVELRSGKVSLEASVSFTTKIGHISRIETENARRDHQNKLSDVYGGGPAHFMLDQIDGMLAEPAVTLSKLAEMWMNLGDPTKSDVPKQPLPVPGMTLLDINKDLTGVQRPKIVYVVSPSKAGAENFDIVATYVGLLRTPATETQPAMYFPGVPKHVNFPAQRLPSATLFPVPDGRFFIIHPHPTLADGTWMGIEKSSQDGKEKVYTVTIKGTKAPEVVQYMHRGQNHKAEDALNKLWKSTSVHPLKDTYVANHVRRAIFKFPTVD